MEPGLRERKKAATRTALSHAAMQLAVEHGVENVTAEAIAAAADVSPRTFHNYFASKEEAIVAAFREQFQVWIDTLTDRPADEPIWDAVQHVCLAQIADRSAGLEKTIERVRLFAGNPAMVAHKLALFDEVEWMFAQAVADRTGTDVERDLYPHLIAAAGAVALKTALRLHAAGRKDADLATLVTEAFALMRAGLPNP
jgi:AcrR family transcriptional regulator